MLACVETLAPLETNLIPSLTNQLAQFGKHLGQIMIPRNNLNWGTTSHINAKYEESKLWWTLGVKQVLRTSVGMGRRNNIIFHGIKICVVAYITFHPWCTSQSMRYIFLEFLEKTKNQKKKDVSRACAEASHLFAIWRVLIHTKCFHIGTSFGNNILHLIFYFL